MPHKKGLILGAVVLLVALGFMTVPDTALAASTEEVLYSFCSISGCDGGSAPGINVVFDAAGNLYGTTSEGGLYGEGNVFQLTPAVDGTWNETVLYNFCSGGWPCIDGAAPLAGLVFDPAGNLYGTTNQGGDHNNGTIFQLTLKNGVWTERVLYSFQGGRDGFGPQAGVVLDASGSLFGTAPLGGDYSYGVLFQLTPMDAKRTIWAEKTVHSFNADGKDGAVPTGGLLIDSAGTLYGTTEYGGTHGWGTVFEFTRGGKSRWIEKILHSFNANSKDGRSPLSNLTLDAAGNLYGTTDLGGSSGTGCGGYGCGIVFQLRPGANGWWTEKVLHSFVQNNKDGRSPRGGVVFDSNGNLYSTTVEGGTYNAGTVFELTPVGNGKWTERMVHVFNDNGIDGAYSWSTMIFDRAGNMYGTTAGGGANGYGTVFEIIL